MERGLRCASISLLLLLLSTGTHTRGPGSTSEEREDARAVKRGPGGDVTVEDDEGEDDAVGEGSRTARAR